MFRYSNTHPTRPNVGSRLDWFRTVRRASLPSSNLDLRRGDGYRTAALVGSVANIGSHHRGARRIWIPPALPLQITG